LAAYFSANVAIAALVAARSGAAQISRRSALAAGWTDLGSLSSTLAVLCTVQRWCRVGGDTSSSAFQKPRKPSPVASSGAIVRPRALRSTSDSRQLWALSQAHLQAEQLLLALGRGSDQHQYTFGLRFHARLQVDAIGPDVDVGPGREIAPLPPLVVRLLFVRSRAMTGGDRFGASLPSKESSGVRCSD